MGASPVRLWTSTAASRAPFYRDSEPATATLKGWRRYDPETHTHTHSKTVVPDAKAHGSNALANIDGECLGNCSVRRRTDGGHPLVRSRVRSRLRPNTCAQDSGLSPRCSCARPPSWPSGRVGRREWLGIGSQPPNPTPTRPSQSGQRDKIQIRTLSAHPRATGDPLERRPTESPQSRPCHAKISARPNSSTRSASRHDDPRSATAGA